jgi:hypothetical protein
MEFQSTVRIKLKPTLKTIMIIRTKISELRIYASVRLQIYIDKNMRTNFPLPLKKKRRRRRRRKEMLTTKVAASDDEVENTTIPLL